MSNLITEKSEEDFYKWLNTSNHINHIYCSFQESGSAPNYEYNINDIDIPDILLISLIIEWFDSIVVLGFKNIYFEEFKNSYTTKSMKQIQEEVIKIVNKIYNEEN